MAKKTVTRKKPRTRSQGSSARLAKVKNVLEQLRECAPSARHTSADHLHAAVMRDGDRDIWRRAFIEEGKAQAYEDAQTMLEEALT